MLDQVDLPFLRALRAEWRQVPPLRVIGAALAGYKSPRETPKIAGSSSKPGDVSIAALKAMFPNGKL